MELKNAKQIISEAVHIAITKGCYGLVEVQNIVAALQKIEAASDVEFGEPQPIESED